MGGINATFDFLAETPNETASDLLVELLDSKDREMREHALTAILKRRECLGQSMLMLRWQDWSDRWKALIAQYSHHMVEAIKQGVASTDDQLHANACDAALWCREYDLVSDLLAVVLKADSEELVARSELTIIRLCEMLSEELFGQGESRRGCNSRLARRLAMRELESAMRKMGGDSRPALVESYLLLATKETSFLRGALDNSSRALGQVMTNQLVSSTRPGVMRVIIDLLQMQHMPTGAAHAASQRCDVPFVRRMFRAIGVNRPEAVGRNTARIAAIAWLDPLRNVLPALNSDEQAAAVAFVCRSGVANEAKLDFLRMAFEQADVSGRCEAAKGLADIPGPEANELVLQASDDEDDRVRAIVAPQLRARTIPGATKRLLQLADCDDSNLRKVAKDCLGDFNFQTYLQSYDELDEQARADTGSTVGRVDNDALEGLVAELESSSRGRRLRALGICPTLNLTDEVSAIVIPLLSDEDPLVRSAAATTLGSCSLPSVIDLLQQAAQDSNTTVVEAARESLARLNAGGSEPSSDQASPKEQGELETDRIVPTTENT